MKKSLVLGIMSGTSIDSVDYALCEIAGQKIRLVELWSADFPKPLQAALHQAARGDLPSHPLAQLHHDLGRFYAQHARSPRAKSPRPDYVGLHGQTVYHHPAQTNPSMLQLGESAYLVESLRVPVINNFRAPDLAAGGQGAPLATMFHQFVFARRGRHVCVNNLGGISNVTSLDWRKGAQPRVLAFDTGPANVLLDMAMRHLTKGRSSMDQNGRLAARGKSDSVLVNRWLKHPYFAQKPPKSTGRELFGEPFFKTAMSQLKRRSTEDILATFTDFTARSLALNYQLHLPKRPHQIILAGGGAANPTLVRAIAESFDDAAVEVTTSDALGWPAQSIEPAAFALLAWLRMNGRPGNIPSTTGARRPALLGQVAEY